MLATGVSGSRPKQWPAQLERGKRGGEKSKIAGISQLSSAHSQSTAKSIILPTA